MSSKSIKTPNPSELPKFSDAQLAFMKLAEKNNLQRVQQLDRTKGRNIWVGAALGLTVLSIYGYTILSIKQEKFLDDFEEPKKVIDTK